MAGDVYGRRGGIRKASRAGSDYSNMEIADLESRRRPDEGSQPAAEIEERRSSGQARSRDCDGIARRVLRRDLKDESLVRVSCQPMRSVQREGDPLHVIAQLTAEGSSASTCHLERGPQRSDRAIETVRQP